MFSVVLCTRNNYEMLLEGIPKLIASSYVGQVVVVNNASSDSTRLWLEAKSINHKLLVINNGKNNGVIKARNQGLCVVDQKYAMVLDDDQFVSEKTFPNYIEALKYHDIVGYEPQIMDLKTGLTKVGTLRDYTYVGAGGMAMTYALWKKLGFFNEVFSPCFFEDPCLCIRAKKLGYTVAPVAVHGIRHVAHSTLNKRRNDLGFNVDAICVRNRKIFLATYGENKGVVVSKLKIVEPAKKESNKKLRVLIVTPNTQIGGVQQHPVALVTGSQDEEIDYRVYSLNPGEGGLHKALVKRAKVYYPYIKEYYTKWCYRNIGHHLRELLGSDGRKYKVKPGGDIDEKILPTNFFNRSFRRMKVEMPTPHASLKEVIRKFKPHIVHTETDRRSMLLFMKGLKNRDFKLVRTFHTQLVENKRMHNNYDAIVAVTCNAHKKYRPKNRSMLFSQVYNGVNVNLFRPKEVVRAEKIVLIHTRLAKVYKLTTEPKMFFKVAKKVVNRYPDVKFVILGSQISENYNEVMNLIKKHGVWDNCIIVPPLSGEELVDYINRAWVWFYPMAIDNFPFSVLEAMACGVPIVSSNITGISEMIKNGVHGLTCNPGDSEMYANNICELLGNRKEAGRLGGNARKRAVEIFSIEKMAKSYEDIYYTLLGRK